MCIFICSILDFSNKIIAKLEECLPFGYQTTIILCYRRAKSPFGFLIKWCIALQVETLDIVFRQITTFLEDSEVTIPLQKIIDKYIWKTLISWMLDIFDFCWKFFLITPYQCMLVVKPDYYFEKLTCSVKVKSVCKYF